MFIFIAGIVVLVVCICITTIVVQKRKQGKEKAESDERILNTYLSAAKVEDSTLEKYE